MNENRSTVIALVSVVIIENVSRSLCGVGVIMMSVTATIGSFVKLKNVVFGVVVAARTASGAVTEVAGFAQPSAASDRRAVAARASLVRLA